MRRVVAAVVCLLVACGPAAESPEADVASRADALTAPDIRLTVSGANSVAQGATYRLSFTVTNNGETYVTPVTVDFTRPAGATLVGSASNRCTVQGNGVRCAMGGLGFRRSVNAWADFAMATAGNASFSGQATAAGDSSPLNNFASKSLAVVAAGPVVAPVPSTGAVLHMQGCGGTVTSFQQCVPGSLFSYDVTLAAGGAVPELDGTWAQNPAQTQLHLTGDNGAMTGAAVAVTTSCFDGLWRTSTGAVVGAFRGCL